MNFNIRLYDIDLNRGATSRGPIHIDRAIGIRLLFYIFYSFKSCGGVFRGYIDGVAKYQWEIGLVDEEAERGEAAVC